MTIAVPALAEFASRVITASWFSVIGEPLTPSKRADAAKYLTTLDLAEVSTDEIATWSDAEACIKATDRN